MTRSLGPNLSTNQPSKGTSHVSNRTKTVKAIWMTACSWPRCFCSGGTNSVQPYWKFATATMLRTLKKRITQRLSSKDPVAVFCAAFTPASVAAIFANLRENVSSRGASPPLAPLPANRRSDSCGLRRSGGCRRRIACDLLVERDHSRNQPFVPHLIDLRLEVVDVIVVEVSEPPLPEKVVAHRRSLQAAVGDVPGFADQLESAVFNLVQRPDTARHRELAELVGLDRIIVPALGARIEGMNEGRPADGESLAHGVHRQDRERHANGGHVAAGRVPRCEHPGHVLLPPMVHDPLHLARRAEGGVRPVRRGTRKLDVCVCVRLVVVH